MKAALKTVLAVFLLVCPMVAAARDRSVPYIPGTRFSDNAIEFPSGKGYGFDRFYKKLDTLMGISRCDLRILHVGGSHVQAGTWTQQLRRNLLSLRYGMDGGRGLVFPYSAAGTNTPMSYTSYSTGNWTFTRCLKPEDDHPLGVTGMSVSTSDPSATIMIDMVERNAREASPGFTFKTVDILGYSTGGAYPVVIMHRDTLVGRRDKASGLWHFDLPHFTDYVRVGVKGLPGELTITGLYLDKPAMGLSVSGAGVNGASTWSWTGCHDWARDIALLKPDLVIFSIGINDIQGTEFRQGGFISNYGKLVSMVRKASPGCAILFTTNNDSYRKGSPNPFTGECTDAFYQLARKWDAGVWNLYRIMGGEGSMQAWEAAGYAQGDRIHFRSEGYDVLGNLLFNAIMDGWRNSRQK